MTVIGPIFSSRAGRIGVIAILVTIIGVVGNVGYATFLAGVDGASEKAIKKAQNDMKQYQILFGSLCKEMFEDAEGINRIAYQIKKGRLDEYRWNLQSRANKLCELTKKFLSKQVVLNESDIVVNYTIKLDDDHMIKTIGCDKALNEKLSIYNKPRDIDDPKAYFDAKMFKCGKSKPVYKLTPEDVDKIFEYENREKESGKYEQCLLIPVMCDENKMVGNFEIVTKRGTKLVDSDREMKNLITLMKIFTSLLLLLQKIEKAATAKPKPDDLDAAAISFIEKAATVEPKPEDDYTPMEKLAKYWDNIATIN